MSDPDETITAINSGQKVSAAEAVATLAQIVKDDRKRLDSHDGRITGIEQWKQRILGAWSLLKISGGFIGVLGTILAIVALLIDKFS